MESSGYVGKIDGLTINPRSYIPHYLLEQLIYHTIHRALGVILGVVVCCLHHEPRVAKLRAAFSPSVV